MCPQGNNCNNINCNSRDEAAEDAKELLILKQIIEAQKAKYLPPTAEELEKIDARSVYVGNVDWNSTVKDIEDHFDGCGTVVRVTIPKDKITGRQRNFAYIEFESETSVPLALVFNGSVFRNRKIFVTPKRTNKPGLSAPTTVGGAPNGRQLVQKTKKEVRVVKYVYVNGAKPTAGSKSKRFNPY